MNKGLIGFFFIISILFFSVLSCNQPAGINVEKENEHDTINRQNIDIPAGYTAGIKCLTDTNQSYDSYLPFNQSGNNALPVIFIFDAHARGHIPVTLYKDLAESFGYVLIASNNSKNGQELAFSMNIYKHLLTDISQRFAIDTRRIYTMGFSGGSRVASAIALHNGGIAGVIGCSAGFPKTEQPPGTGFNFIGIAGNEDFNMTEMKSLDEMLGKTAIKHQLLIFNGKHDWCPPQIMKEAFFWITFNAMRDQLISRNDSLIKSFISSQDSIVKKLQSTGNEYGLSLTYGKIVNFLEGLEDVSVYKEKYNQLQLSDRVHAYKTYLNRIAAEEARLQQQYQAFMVERDLAWWKAEMINLNQSILKDKNPEEALFKKRLMSYMSLLAYSNANNTLNSNQLDQAARFIKIYALVDPANPEHAYLNAVLMMKYNNPQQAIAAIKEAVKLGFEDKIRMAEQPEFAGIRSNDEYNNLVSNIK